MTNNQYKKNPIGLTKNESEHLEKLSEKLRRLEKIKFNEHKNYSQHHRKDNNFLINKEENKGRITAPNPLQFNKTKENILIDKSEIQKYNMDLLQDVKEAEYPGSKFYFILPMVFSK